MIGIINQSRHGAREDRSVGAGGTPAVSQFTGGESVRWERRVLGLFILIPPFEDHSGVGVMARSYPSQRRVDVLLSPLPPSL